ncbi:MAG: pyridoxamine 5'-phosphate oxidase family protein, partial [Thermoplasmata archaeon]|nr:pyridoxamine 5'-phosphate oxidase family protein [Thermoplasmata archaeon]
ILTGTKDAKTPQIRSNPNVELLLDLEDGENRGYVRFIGTATIVEDKETKNRIAPAFPFFTNYWETADDPNCTLIEAEVERLEYMQPGEFLAKYFEI